MKETVSESTSIISGRNRDCTGCRLVSGSGLIGAGLYVAYHSKAIQKATGRIIMLATAGTFLGLGITRVLDLPPFRDQFHHE